jgi:hypothetical protein
MSAARKKVSAIIMLLLSDEPQETRQDISNRKKNFFIAGKL